MTEVAIHVDPQKQLARSSSNLEIRITRCVKLRWPDWSGQPSLALPALQSAREKATPDQRWWIDAAIQQIEETLAKDKRP